MVTGDFTTNPLTVRAFTAIRDLSNHMMGTEFATQNSVLSKFGYMEYGLAMWCLYPLADLGQATCFKALEGSADLLRSFKSGKDLPPLESKTFVVLVNEGDQ